MLEVTGISAGGDAYADLTKIEKLLFVLAIAVCWAYKIGELQARKVPITVKKHGRKLKSIFRLGPDLIRRALFREDDSLLKELTVFHYLGLTGKRGLI